MRVSLIIPALNEAECIGPLLAEMPDGVVHQIVVVDNGSTDGTGEAAQAAGAQVVREARRGYGYACAAGVAAAGGDILAFMDGDGSFVPGELAALLAPLGAGAADLALGSRFLGGMAPGAMPPHQLFGNQLVAKLVGARFGLRLTDLGPFRVIRRDLLLQPGHARIHLWLARGDDREGRAPPSPDRRGSRELPPALRRTVESGGHAARLTARHLSHFACHVTLRILTARSSFCEGRCSRFRFTRAQRWRPSCRASSTSR